MILGLSIEFSIQKLFLYILIPARFFFVQRTLSLWCLCQIYVQCSCLHFFQAIELSIETLFPYYTYIFAQKILCLHTFTIYVHNTKSKKKQCLNCWLYECTFNFEIINVDYACPLNYQPNCCSLIFINQN